MPKNEKAELCGTLLTRSQNKKLQSWQVFPFVALTSSYSRKKGLFSNADLIRIASYVAFGGDHGVSFAK